ncbi:MAG: choice-of-anchor tandem repeat GloVer-containing protein [Candidatus Tumulicola sp.]
MTYLHSFGSDGYAPYGPLLSVGGTLYGTTLDDNIYEDRGTVYSITSSGTYAILHTFGDSPDGASPYAGLVNIGGTLYGTTSSGGAYNGGAVYSVSPAPSGTESVLESFYPGSDGANPIASLIANGSTLYGTTSQGGVYNAGTAFSMTTSGAETVLHSFGGSGDGTDPAAPLLNVRKKLYGTTVNDTVNGCGSVFAVTKSSGHETVLHSFSGRPDGCTPQYGALINLNGTMYGTTSSGGNGGCGFDEGCGTVFSITPSGTETVLHTFAAGTDGATPYGGLTVLNGMLYGTTSAGGAYGRGTVFMMSPSPSGAYAVIWAFGGQPGGAQPQSDLIVVNGTLYGTTTAGGANNQGTVFSLLSI